MRSRWSLSSRLHTVTAPFDPHAGPPDYVYVRIADHLAAGIEDGTYPADSMLPGERALAEDYGVGVNTLRRALDVLRERGLIITLPAKGTFVVRQRADP
jgi:GntR family transcriptional regulator